MDKTTKVNVQMFRNDMVVRIYFGNDRHYQKTIYAEDYANLLTLDENVEADISDIADELYTRLNVKITQPIMDILTNRIRTFYLG